jgi:tetratricopeptide (TPR) repeat protein
MIRPRSLVTITILCVAAATAFSDDAVQAASSRAADRSPSCAREVRSYELSPASANVADTMAQCFKARSQSAEAAAIFRRVAEKPNGPGVAWKYAGKAYDDANQYADAEAAYLKYLQKTPDTEARLALAGVYRSEKLYDKALEQYRLVLSSHPKSSGALAGIGRTLFLQGQEDESLRYYDRAIAADPKDVEAQTARAYALLWMDRSRDAEAAFARLHERYPQNDNVSQGLQKAQKAVQAETIAATRRSGDTTALESQLQQQLAKNPIDLGAIRMLAELTAGRPQRCADYVGYRRRVTEILSSDSSAGIDLARAQVECSHLDEAVAAYRKVLQVEPANGTALLELGGTLWRAGRAAESVEAFQNALRVNPNSFDAHEGIARALVSLDKDAEALAHYDEALKVSPDNYEALQGKGYLLYWTDKYPEARVIFETLAKKNPGDAQNAQVLQRITDGQESARWAAIRPAATATPQDWLRYYAQRLADYPKDQAALRGWAAAQTQLKNYPEAIQGYRRVLAAYPDDHNSRLDLARVLSWNGDFDESISFYQQSVKEAPTDTEALESLARVYRWGDHLPEALQTYQKLMALDSSNLNYQLEIARLQLRMKDSRAAREFLTTLLASDPKNREAMLLLADLALTHSHYDVAVKEYEQVLKLDPKDTAALYGQARMYYYMGDFSRAYKAGSALVAVQPDSTDALFLMANIQRVRGNRTEALALLDKTLIISPDYKEAQSLRARILESGRVTLSTGASYVREIGKTGTTGQTVGIDEDIREFNYDATLGFSFLPHTDSQFSGTLMPSESPIGGLAGAAGPSRFLYSQSTDFGRRWKVRAGIGLVRFGPGEAVSLPGEPQNVTVSRSFSPLGGAGVTYSATDKLKLDVGWNRSHMAYTPTATRLAAIDNHFSASADYDFTKRVRLSVEYYHGAYSSGEYNHTTTNAAGQAVVTRFSDHDEVHGGTVVFRTKVYNSSHLSLDAGYRANVYGHPDAGVFLGFYNPSFYQSHLFTTDWYGKLFGPLSYDFYGAVGGQQAVDESFTRGTKLRPSFSLRINRNLTLQAGYSYYNTAETLGNLSGHSMYLTTNWTF